MSSKEQKTPEGQAPEEIIMDQHEEIKAPGVLFTFPSQYYALSVTKEYSALGGGPPDFPQGFSCLVVLRILLDSIYFPLHGSHALWPAFPKRFR